MHKGPAIDKGAQRHALQPAPAWVGQGAGCKRGLGAIIREIIGRLLLLAQYPKKKWALLRLENRTLIISV